MCLKGTASQMQNNLLRISYIICVYDRLKAALNYAKLLMASLLAAAGKSPTPFLEDEHLGRGILVLTQFIIATHKHKVCQSKQSWKEEFLPIDSTYHIRILKCHLRILLHPKGHFSCSSSISFLRDF